MLLFFHGGGYCSGSIVSHRRMVTEAGRAAGMRTLAVGYRLAPEHPFPAAHDDALAAWRFLRGAGHRRRHIAIGGDSAGGELTIALINRLREAGEELPACAWLVSPWTDLTDVGRDARRPRTPSIRSSTRPISRSSPTPTSPAPHRPQGPADLAASSPISPGLPPTLIQVGSAETLLDDAVRFAARGRRGRTSPVTLEIWPHMIHAWHLWTAQLEDGRRALASAGRLHPRKASLRMH